MVLKFNFFLLQFHTKMKIFLSWGVLKEYITLVPTL